MPKLLLVDDDDSVRLTLAIALRRRGFEVKTAEDGLAAVEMLRREAFHWVITDVRMPGMTGIELASQVKRMCHGTRTVLMSAYAVDEALRGVDVAACLEKPIDETQLVRVLGHDSGESHKPETEREWARQRVWRKISPQQEERQWTWRNAKVELGEAV